MLLDFEVAFFGHPSFDVATLINHLLLKAFHAGKPWRAAMIANTTVLRGSLLDTTDLIPAAHARVSSPD